MQKTKNYNLNQWESTDKLSRVDFNSDNAAIDAALAAKAEKSVVTSVETALNNYKTSNNAAVAKKAEQSALESTNTALGNTNTALAALEQTVGTKAATVDVTALSQNVAALSAALGSGGSTCRVAWGSYTGTGAFGKNSPTELSFDFCPVVVVIGCDKYAKNTTSPCVLVRGCTQAVGAYEFDRSFDCMMYLTWSENGVSWYSPEVSGCQNNEAGCTYHYAALGYDAAAEEG